MKIFFRWLWAPGIIPMLYLSAFAQSAAPAAVPPAWPVSTSPARFVIVFEPDHDKPVGAGVLDLVFPLPEPKWENCPSVSFTDTGVAVGSDLLWTAHGSYRDSSLSFVLRCEALQIYVGSNWPPLHLAEAKSGVWLESREGDGRIMNNLPDMLQAWDKSTKVLGRALVQGIFEGGHRFGVQGNLFEHMQGWFELEKPEHLELSVISVDGSFVLVDGKEVVEWPGRHNWHYGPAGPPQGAVDLPAGIHELDYYNAFKPSERGRPPVLCCLAVKDSALPAFTMMTPDNTFFRPVMHDHIVSYDLQGNSSGGASVEAVPAMAMEWSIKDQSIINSDLADRGLISLQLRCISPPPGTVTWTFDDGSSAQGPNVEHLFPRPGMRKIQCTVENGGKQVATLTETVRVHIDWANTNSMDPHLNPDHEKNIMDRDPATLSAPDLSSSFAVLGVHQKRHDLLQLLPEMCAKMKDVPESDLPYLSSAALFLVHDDRGAYAKESQLLRTLVDRSGQPNPAPPTVAVNNECRLACAELALKTSDDLKAVQSLIDGINVPALSGDQARELSLLRADMALASGDVAGARKQYEGLTGDPSGPDVRSSIRRTAKISQARAFIDRKDNEAAEDALNEVSWQAPIEKLSTDWALTRLRLYQEENLPVAAYLWAKRLLPVITGSARSELLFRLTKLAFAQGDNDLAGKSLSELLKKHPYSDEAAQAKHKWPREEQP